MKQSLRIVSLLIVVMFTLCCFRPLRAEVPLMKVRFIAEKIVKDKETGDTIHFIDHDLFALPDTINMGNLYSTSWTNVLLRQIEAPAGAKFMVRVRTHVPDKKWYKHPEGQKEYEYLVKYISEVQGQHETVWLGPFTVPDTVNTPDGIVDIKLPPIMLSRAK